MTKLRKVRLRQWRRYLCRMARHPSGWSLLPTPGSDRVLVRRRSESNWCRIGHKHF